MSIGKKKKLLYPLCVLITIRIYYQQLKVFLRLSWSKSTKKINFFLPASLVQKILFPWNDDSLFSSVQFSCSVVSNSLPPHEPQHARPPCPSPTPSVHPNPCPLSRWCHPTISSSVIPFSSCPQSFPASGSFQMSQLFTSGGQSIGVSASTSVLPMNTQDWSPLRWTGWISLQSKGLSRVFSNTTIFTSIYTCICTAIFCFPKVHIMPLHF